MELIERLNEWGTRDTERGKQLYKDIQDAIQQLKKIQSERDGLLAALKVALAYLPIGSEQYEKTKEAISKCES